VWVDRTDKALRYKERTIGAASIVVTAPSQWMLDEASRSYLSRFPMRHIENPVDTDIFRPMDASGARRQLGIPADATVFLLPASNVRGTNYKGLSMLRGAMALLGDSTALLVTFGQPPKGPAPHVAERFVPAVRNEREMSQYFAAADVVVYPSSAENSPLAVIEAMASGRPVVTTAVGGVPELLTDGIEGLLVAPTDVPGLAHALRWLLANPSRVAAMGEKGVQRARQRHATPVVLEQWLSWHRELTMGGA
jgi:glycosyltransferase involved in cell wall biosynthesis